MLPWKPKGMHWRTYERIVREIRAKERAADAEFAAAAEALFARIDRKYGPLGDRGTGDRA